MSFLPRTIISGNFLHINNMYLNDEKGKYVLRDDKASEKKGETKNYEIEENIVWIKQIDRDMVQEYVNSPLWRLIKPYTSDDLLKYIKKGKYCSAMRIYPKWRLIAVLDEKDYLALRDMANKNAAAKGCTFDVESDKEPELNLPVTTAVEVDEGPDVSLDDLPALKQLLDDGGIAEEEFIRLKKKALGL